MLPGDRMLALLYDPGLCLDLMDRGAFDFIALPYRTEDVRWILGTALLRCSQPAPLLMTSPGAISVMRRYDGDCYRPRVSDGDSEQQEHPGRYHVKADLGPSKQHQGTSGHKGVCGEREHDIGEDVGTFSV